MKIQVFKEQNGKGEWFVTSTHKVGEYAFVNGVGDTIDDAIADLKEFVGDELEIDKNDIELEFVPIPKNLLKK